MSSEVKLRSAKLAPMVSSGFKDKPINSSSNITKTLTNEQTCEKRNTHLHNLCIQMLRYVTLAKTQPKFDPFLEMVFIEPILNYSTWLKIGEKHELLLDQDPICL